MSLSPAPLSFCIPENPTLGNLFSAVVAATDDGTRGSITLSQAIECTPVITIVDVPWSSNTSAPVTQAQIVLQTSGGIAEDVLEELIATFAAAFVEAMKLVGYQGSVAVDSMTTQGDDILIDASFGSPLPVLIAIAVIVALIAVVAAISLKAIQILAPIIGPGIDIAIPIVAGALLVGVVAIGYSYAKDKEGRKKVRDATGRAASSLKSHGTAAVKRLAS